MSEDPNAPPIDGDPSLTAGDDDATEVDASEIVTDDKGNKTVSLSTMLRYKKEAKALSKQVKDMKPIADRAMGIEARLGQAQPIIDAIVTNPKLRAEALRLAQGSRPSGETTDQPTDDDDAAGYAEDAGYYLSDGQTPDVARARRVMDRQAKLVKRTTDDAIRPLAGLTLTEKANANLREAAAQVDDDGTPLATPESIREYANQLPPHLLANPQVVTLLIDAAMGLDRRKHRTPKAADEPVFLERQGGGGRREPMISPEEKKQLERLGLTEKDYAASSKRLEQGVASRRGIVLGS